VRRARPDSRSRRDGQGDVAFGIRHSHIVKPVGNTCMAVDDERRAHGERLGGGAVGKPHRDVERCDVAGNVALRFQD
jgi:hypothetical protein